MGIFYSDSKIVNNFKLPCYVFIVSLFTLSSEANKKLQDTNDSMRNVVDMSAFRNGNCSFKGIVTWDSKYFLPMWYVWKSAAFLLNSFKFLFLFLKNIRNIDQTLPNLQC